MFVVTDVLEPTEGQNCEGHEKPQLALSYMPVFDNDKSLNLMYSISNTVVVTVLSSHSQ